ncbi:unnamed protein product [Pieris brassicae]|uniref:Uncharacterized protein n=1 Tax=Pieris brassicae TaxID=7116 RepID=A0A9P0TFC1_PIEBR|nr:unnamed protein product [Pieris brassicae]
MGSECFETNSLDFTEFWANTGVNSEVLRGTKLREEKPNCSKKQQQFTPVNININGSVKKMHKHRRGKRKPVTNTKSRCLMRLAELAIPSKRQCLDTWRNRGKTLPNFMVDRLRQYVMDEKAVVHIKDAIYCFKSQKLKRSRSNKLKFIKNGNIDKEKLFCAIFGHRIVMKLLPCGRIPVPTSLKNLTEIVNNDIEQLLRRRKRNTIHKTIRDEISEKVTVWIASVLDESDINLMMDDFEGNLEEKEGHVWDIIDDLIEAVVENCKSESISYVEEKYPSRTISFHSIVSNISRLSLNKEEKTSFYDDINNITSNTNEYKINMIDVILLDIIDSICRYDNQINGFVQNLLDKIVSEVIAIDKEEINIKDEIKTDGERNTIDMTGSHLPKMIILEQADSVNDFSNDTPESNTSNLENRAQTKNTDAQNDFNNQTYYDIIPKDTSTHDADNDVKNESNNSENKESITIREKIQLIESAENTQTEPIQEDDALNQLTVSETKPHIENELDATESKTSKLENGALTKNTDEQNYFDNQTYYEIVPKDTSTHGADNDIIKESNNSGNQESVTIREKIQLMESPENTQTEQIQEDDALNQLTVSEIKPSIEYGLDTNVSTENIQLELKDSYEWSEDSFKKVKFSDTNIGNEQRSIDGDSKYNKNEASFLHKKLSSSSQRNYFKHINFSPPNTHLLYNVDETWPEEFYPLTTKLSATVSKSVISLGFINEADEKSIPSPITLREREQNVEKQFVADISNLCEEILKDSNDLQKTFLLNICDTNTAIESKYQASYQTSQGSGSICLNIKRSHEKGDNGDGKELPINYVGKSQNTRKLTVKVLSCINIASEIEVSSDKGLTKEKQIQTDSEKIRLNPNTNSIKTQKDKEWLHLKKSVDSDRKVWHHLYKRLSIGINSYKNNFKENNAKIKSVQPKSCICRGF